VTTCGGVTLNGASATCTGAGGGNKCEYTAERAAGSATWLPAARVYDFDTDDAPVSLSIDFQDDDIVEDQTESIAPGGGSAVEALEINTVSSPEGEISGDTYTSVVPGATVTNLRTSTEYRFAIQFVSAAGDGAVSEFSPR